MTQKPDPTLTEKEEDEPGAEQDPKATKKQLKKKTTEKTATKKKVAKKATKKKIKKKTQKKTSKKKKSSKPRRSPEEIAAAQAKVNGIADVLHAIVREAAPELILTERWGHDWYAKNELVVGIALHREHVNLVVYNGEEVNDPEDLMKGVGYNRAVRVDNVEDIRRAPMLEIVRTSARADAKKPPSSETFHKKAEPEMATAES